MIRKLIYSCLLVTGLMLSSGRTVCAAAPVFVVDFAEEMGPVKPLHGVNNGPFAYGENAKLEGYHASAGFPHTRLHDVHWPYPDAVDIHCIFPLFDADADDPKNYTFAKTDAYIAAIVRNKSSIIYRLGESIEPWTEFHTHPPKDFAKWAKICVNIIRHYNEGWANGFHYDIKYWEIWNEPELTIMWKGTREQYFALYETVALAIKAHQPELKVGGPAATHTGSDLVKPFLAFCRDKKLPLDFFSWHAYRASPKDLASEANNARKLLDEHGFPNAELHLNEWQYLTTWDGLRPENPRDYVNVPEWFARSTRAEGAAFCAAALIHLQDTPITVANYYSADTSPWSMFGTFGIPTKVFHAFRTFNDFAKAGTRVRGEGELGTGLAAVAALRADKRGGAVMLSNFKGDASAVTIQLKNTPWSGKVRVEVAGVDDSRDYEPVKEQTVDGGVNIFDIEVPANSVRLVRITPD